MSETSGNGNGRGIWSTVASVARHSPWALLAFLLVGTLLGWTPSPLAEIHQKLAIHVEYDKANNKLLRVICRNTAKTDHMAALCD